MGGPRVVVLLVLLPFHVGGAQARRAQQAAPGRAGRLVRAVSMGQRAAVCEGRRRTVGGGGSQGRGGGVAVVRPGACVPSLRGGGAAAGAPTTGGWRRLGDGVAEKGIRLRTCTS
jgi:hypothetical protein